ncbi:hypothetical protein ACGFZL_00265 [Streptomyces sp. NPDC048182]|uniref:hypothetical protein n=1 Tax=Streptomyces sp. NPDC048182 TaxID=3365507 RepID=UPI00371112E8
MREGDVGGRSEERSKPYTGPLAIEVPIEQWGSFSQHAPGWWPSSKDFSTPDAAVLRRVRVALMRKLVAASDEE